MYGSSLSCHNLSLTLLVAALRPEHTVQHCAQQSPPLILLYHFTSKWSHSMLYATTSGMDTRCNLEIARNVSPCLVL